MKFNLNIKHNTVIFAVLMAFCVIAFIASAHSEETYIYIGTKAELEAFRDRVNNGETMLNAKLTANIILQGSEKNQWTPIGNDIQKYSGKFDGQGYKISGIYIDESGLAIKGVGLFGCVSGADIKNLTAIGTVIGKDNTACICGYACNGTTITNCVNEGIVESRYGSGRGVGGVCGTAQSVTITGCINKGNIKGRGYVIGGVCGSIGADSSVSSCENQGDVTNNVEDVRWTYTGGICGEAAGFVTLSNCVNEANVSGGAEYTGGICGEAFVTENSKTVVITDCVNKGNITGNKSGGICGESLCNNRDSIIIADCINEGEIRGGGICGHNLGTIRKCINQGSVTRINGEYISGGGITASNYGSGYIYNCINKGIVAGDKVGGISGYNFQGTIWNCVNEANINGNGSGGIFGYGCNSRIDSCINTGNINGNNGDAGGICGDIVGFEKSSSTTVIYNCINEGNVTGNGYIGGICGVTEEDSTTITSCVNEGRLTGNGYVGGICGNICPGTGWEEVVVKYCINTGELLGNGYIGLICGRSATYHYDTIRVIVCCGYIKGSATTIIGKEDATVDVYGVKEYAKTEIPATSAVITLNKLAAGNTETAVEIYPKNACNKSSIGYGLSSSDASVATINGIRATGIAHGETNIGGSISKLIDNSSVNISRNITVTDAMQTSNYKMIANVDKVSPGETLTAKIQLLFENLQNKAIAAIDAVVNYATDIFEVVSVQKSGISGAKEPVVDKTSGKIDYRLENASGTEFVESQYYDFGTITFKVKKNAKSSVVNLFITDAVYQIVASYEKKVPTVTDSTITISVVPVNKINLYSETGIYSILVGNTLQLYAEVLPTDASNKDVEWSSSNESIATVDANGLVTAKEISGKSATVTITASAVDGSGVTGNIQLTVTRPDLTGISFAKKAYRVLAGNSQDLYAELNVAPEMALKPQATNIIWSSDNAKITVDANGRVTMANDAENVTGTITAQCVNEKSQTVSCTATVTTEKVSVNLNLATKLEGRQSGGGTGTNVEKIEVWLYDSANNPLWNGTGTTDTNGNVSFEIEADALEEGKTVKLWIKGERYLAKLLTQTVTLSGSDWNVTMPSALKAADTNADNRVASADFLVLRKSYMYREGSAQYDRLADFDANGRIASPDFLMLRRNYMVRGDAKPQAAVTMLMTAAARKGTTDTAMEVLSTETAKVAEEALANSTAEDIETQEEEIIEAVENATGATFKAARAKPSSSSDSSSSSESSGSSSSGGCNAGYGALALLFAVPMLYRRKK